MQNRGVRDWIGCNLYDVHNLVIKLPSTDFFLTYCVRKHIRVFEEHIQAGPSKKGAYGFSDLIRANDVDYVIHDVTVQNVKHASQTI